MRSGVGGPVEISPRGPLGSDRVAFHAYSGGSAYQRSMMNLFICFISTSQDGIVIVLGNHRVASLLPSLLLPKLNRFVPQPAFYVPHPSLDLSQSFIQIVAARSSAASTTACSRFVTVGARLMRSGSHSVCMGRRSRLWSTGRMTSRWSSHWSRLSKFNI